MIAGASHANGLNFVGCVVAQARRVHKAETQAVDAHFILDEVAGGAGNGRHDGPLLAQQSVEQRGFARVGPAGNYGGDAVFDDVAQLEGAQQAAHQGLHFIQQIYQTGAVGKLHVFFTEIQLQLQQRGELDEAGTQLA